LGLAAWGYDTWVLAHSNAELAWAKLEVGLPLLLLIGAATGALARRRDRAGVWVGAWMVSGALTGVVVGEMPFAGHNLATWIAEPRLWGVNVYPIDPAGAARTAFIAIVTGSVGSVVGLVGHHLVGRARDMAAPRRFLGAMLTLCLPLAVLTGLFGDTIINTPLRLGPQTVHTAISTGLAGDVASNRHQFPAQARYRLHLVDYDSKTSETQGRETIDVAFDSGIVVRCQVSGRKLTGCSPIWPKIEAWMDAVIQEGLRGEQRTALEPQADGVLVDKDTQRWLVSQREMMSERYEISRDTQRGGWIITSARFDTGYVLTCYFHGAAPVVLDRCKINQDTRR